VDDCIKNSAPYTVENGDRCAENEAKRSIDSIKARKYPSQNSIGLIGVDIEAEGLVYNKVS